MEAGPEVWGAGRGAGPFCGLWKWVLYGPNTVSGLPASQASYFFPTIGLKRSGGGDNPAELRTEIFPTLHDQMNLFVSKKPNKDLGTGRRYCSWLALVLVVRRLILSFR